MVQKILELKGKNFMQGLSLQANYPIGGVFKSMSGFDPFEDAGYLRGSLTPAQMTDTNGAPSFIINVRISNVPYAIVHTPTHVYKYLRNSPYTQTDVTTSIDFTKLPAGGIYYNGVYVYNNTSKTYAWDLVSGSSTNILNGGGGDTNDVRRFCVGPDKNLYLADFGAVDKIITVSTTVGNTFGVFNVDFGYTIRDLTTDGNYLIIIADNNVDTTTSRVLGTYNCRVYYWDMDTTRTTANQIWDIQDSYLIGCQFQQGVLHIWGANGLYVCDYVTSPKMILDVSNPNSSVTAWPTNPHQITQSSNTLYWGDGSTGLSAAGGFAVMAYGKFPGQQNKIFYSPYVTTLASGIKHTALQFTAGGIWAGVSPTNAFSKLFLHNVGTTRGDATVYTAPITFDQPYQFSHIKVSLRQPLNTGQSVQIGANDGNANPISASVTQSYSVTNPRKNLIFLRTVTNPTSRPEFEDLSIFINPIAGAKVSRVSVYASPISDSETSL